MSAAAFRQRLREDLKTAMRARNDAEMRLLRALGAAVDNAEAVPLEDEELRRFEHGEIARRELSDAEIAELLERERNERLQAADDFARLDQRAEAARLRSEAEMIARYA